jgi:hypothetical protein
MDDDKPLARISRGLPKLVQAARSERRTAEERLSSR